MRLAIILQSRIGAARGHRRVEPRGVVPASVATRRARRMVGRGKHRNRHSRARRSDSALHNTPRPNPLTRPARLIATEAGRMIANLITDSRARFVQDHAVTPPSAGRAPRNTAEMRR